jgi:glycosyltransferase involved in cell wall biosynthesis
MAAEQKLKIVIVGAFYSEGMGYSENCLSRALARRGHDVHVVTSTYNVYANEPMYDDTYRAFLGERQAPAGTRSVDGYTLHRLEGTLVSGYVYMKGLGRKIAELAPNIVHSLEVASLQTFELAARRPLSDYKLFCETHQTLSVMRPYVTQKSGAWLRKSFYWLTRTLPSHLASLMVERCYAVAADCVDVAIRYYGVPASKVQLLVLGTDTELFHPVESPEDAARRRELRQSFGYTDHDLVCVYTGRFTRDKNPLVLAQAIDALSRFDPRFKALFIGEGVQKDEIAACRNATIRSFMTHTRLADHYRAADIAVWPRQESMSMLDAAASGLPVIASDRIGSPERVKDSGEMYEENSVESLGNLIRSFAAPEKRRKYGSVGRQRMLQGFSWTGFASTVESDFRTALNGKRP